MIYEMVRKAMLAGLGVQDKMKELVDDLVSKGEISEREGAKLVKEFIDKAKTSSTDIRDKVNDTVGKGYEAANIATKEEHDRLAKKIQQLTVRVKKLENELKASGEG
jgi:polyhydroxyalkanoate synthesis regulator phasin